MTSTTCPQDCSVLAAAIPEIPAPMTITSGRSLLMYDEVTGVNTVLHIGHEQAAIVALLLLEVAGAETEPKSPNSPAHEIKRSTQSGNVGDSTTCH